MFIEKVKAANSNDFSVEAPGGIIAENVEAIDIITQLANVLAGIAGGIAVAAIMWAGILWATSAGDEDKIETAKTYIRYSLIGLIVAVTAWTIVRIVVKFFTE